ncbi:hypothetical protein BKM25_23195 [Pseudomonas avellanae]|nr:hypothetical protein AO261_26615 [Pseudomonas avellanae]POC81735.1 hypothetical protein BKM08_28015 [Pseudomonas amygdali pv. morsprunorum]POC82062.1 hypothetical protein BKM26_27615 [Pseudomonas avellanae]POR73183.1 hypothetical protein BKM25_23195 [Pseudomonas avellanae]
MTEEDMRLALFGSGRSAVRSDAPQAKPQAVNDKQSTAVASRKAAKNFVPKLIVTLRVGNEFEGATELIVHDADTLSRLQAEVEAMKIARKKFKYVELVSVMPAK